eukprot:s3624_g3.t1
MSSDVNPRDSQQRDQGVAPEDVANTATRQRATPEAPLGTETTAVAVQAGLTQESQTTLDAGRRSDLENVITGAEAAENVTGFVTPKSASGTRTHAPPAWLGNVEIPRWVSRLGAFLNQGGVVAQADLAPSPFPGSMHSLSPPPGGQVFRLRSPTRPHAIPPAPSPPSSSSLPQEAIQQEVQRQLQGIVGQLKDYSSHNARLEEELVRVKAELRSAQEQIARGDRAAPSQGGLLGDLAFGSLDPGRLDGYPDTLPPELPSRVSHHASVQPHGELPQGLGLSLRDPPGVLDGARERPCDGQPRRDLPDNRGHHEPGSPEEPSRRAQSPDGATGILRSWWNAGAKSRGTTPPPRAPDQDGQDSPVLAALARGVQQLQELQAQAMTKATTTTATEQVKPGTPSLTMMPDLSEGADSALTFQDWLEVSGPTMSDLSESSATWWQGVLGAVNEVYKRWLTASPLEKLSIEPGATEEWCTGRWLRVNARASTMLLGAMTSELRADMVSRRCTQDCVKMMYRLYTHYQPGGSAERHEVLRRLQAPQEYVGTETLENVVKTLRLWPRWMERCKAVQMTPPDPSVLSRGLQSLTAKHIEASSDASFRTSMLRASLRLDARPSLEQVAAYQRHLQAELEVLLVGKTSTGAGIPQPKLRAVESGLPPKARDAGGKSANPTDMCRYFAKACCCKRGDKCTYSHNMSHLDKEVRAKKCLRCGSEAHRQKECPVGKAGAKGWTPKGSSSTKPDAGQLPSSGQSTMATLATTTTPTSTLGDPVQGTPWTLEALVQAAQQIVQAPTADSAGETSPEKTRPSMKVLRVRDLRVCSIRATTTALVDSGATHSLRSAKSQHEWDHAEDVAVQLAGSHQLVMRITESGTLLMPYKSGGRPAGDQDGLRAQTIVPMGQLIQTLGYSMSWTPEECVLTSPEGERIPLQTDGGCPEIKEMEALSLIARLEDRKLDLLKNETAATVDKLNLSALTVERPWNYFLYDYVANGTFESGLRAVRDAPFFSDVPGESLAGLIPSAGLWSGWSIMKEIGFLNRSQRRKLWNSKKWIVHLYAGENGHWELFKLDQGETTVLELDMARCAGHNVMRSEVWRMLLWGAKEGKIDMIFGGPPSRAANQAKGGTRDIKSLTLIARMMWLYAVAEVGRELNGSGITKDREVGFMIEYPEGVPYEERVQRAAQVREADEAHRSAEDRGEPAAWEQTINYWNQVQRPRWEEFAGRSTLDGRAAFWETRMWKLFQQETHIRMVSFDQGAMGGETRNRTTLGTNVNNLMSLDGIRLPEDDPRPDRGPRDHVWAPGLVNALVVALSFWEKDARSVPRLQAMTPEKWKEHVDSNHAIYRKDCATCVMGRGIGRQHRRVHHPEAFVLTADVAGPLSPGLDSTSKGTLGRNLKYLLVAKYMVPRAFVCDYSGKQPPEDHGLSSDGEAGRPSANKGDPQVKHVGFLDEAHIEEENPTAEIEVIPEDLAEEELDYEMSEPEPGDEKDTSDPVEGGVTNATMMGGDCEPPEMTYLVFGAALPNNQAATVRRALQDVVLYLQMHGLPVYRFHSDKGEFYNHQFRNWLRDQGVYGTWSEPSVPQSNGHAESTVRWLKDRTRTFLRAAGLPTRLWPVAAAMAAAEQRAKVLNWKSSLVAPFGAPVHIKKKAFDKAGPLRREHGLESKWLVGKYVGLSTIVHKGHLVYVEASEEEKEKFLHTLHVRPDLVDPGVPTDAMVVDSPPRPKRRIGEKRPVEDVEMKAVTKSSLEWKEYATNKSADLLDSWDQEEAFRVVEQLARTGFFESKKFGVYRHGGTVGWLSGLVEFPELSKVLARIVLEINPVAAFTSVMVSYNAPRAMHKDFNNDYQTQNYVVPIQCPDQGGELWVELKPGDVVKGAIEQRDMGEKRLYGQLYELQPGTCISFGPQCYHEVSDWNGERTVLIAYTPDCLGKLSQEDLEGLHEHGFPIPLSQLPEYHGDLQIMEDLPQVRTALVDGDLLEHDADWTMYLDLEPGLVKIADTTTPIRKSPLMRKTEVVYTRNIENILANLSGPLDVTYTISPEEVMSNLEAWRPAIIKEVKGVEVAIDRLLPGTESRRRWFNNPKAQRLPMKFVFTIKPSGYVVENDPSTWYKRKARLVICGNMATEGDTSLYTETAPAEVVRSALAVTSRNAWSVAILDVVAAFLRTPLGRSEKDPVVIAQPPRLLETMGLCDRFEMWGLVRALYGLREAPTLWGGYRDDVLQALPLPRGLKWQQGRAITAWWTIRGTNGEVCAIVVVYVDDFMICGPYNLVIEIGEVIQTVWETSELTFLGPQSAIRFLGMELQRSTENDPVIQLTQQGYVTELLRLHRVKKTQLDKVPITRELTVNPEKLQACDPEKIREAQQITGEVLWMSQRTRPDLSYTTSIMASLCTKCPEQTIAIGAKVLGYLQRTMDYGLVIKWSNKGLTMFCDAAFAPQGAHSHSGWLVTYGGVPIVWRSGRQTMITLSTAESELLSLLDGAVATKGVEAILADIGEVVEDRELASDSTSALSISSGSSSWRTRHLRIKAGWLSEQLSHGLFRATHCPGATQPADLLTKALSSMRMEMLLGIWGIADRGKPRVSTCSTRTSARVLVALICCLLMVSTRATQQDDRSAGPLHALQVDWDTVSILMVLLMILGSLCVWEMLKWFMVEVVSDYVPGSSQRKIRRLRKLQVATSEAIEKEITRLREMTEDGLDRRRTSETPRRRDTARSEDLATESQPSSSTLRAGRGAGKDDVQQPSIPRSSPMSEHLTASSTELVDSEQEIVRVCVDTCALMTCEHLKEGLRSEGLAVSGLKGDQTQRLGSRLAQLVALPTGPTVKQLRYVLWLWRAKDLAYKHVLRYHEIVDRIRISSLIHMLKMR